MLVGQQQGAWAVDALGIARFQVEAIYTLCLLLRDAGWVYRFLKAGWKKKYVRFLLERWETRRIHRFAQFFGEVGPAGLDKMASVIGVTTEERRWIEWSELFSPMGPAPVRAEILDWPSPLKVMKALDAGLTVNTLKRLYPEYRHLCSFAHGDAEAAALRILVDTRSVMRHHFPPEKSADLYIRQVCTPAVMYSVIASLLAATEVQSLIPQDVDLAMKVNESWLRLRGFSHVFVAVYDLRARNLFSIRR